MAAFRNELKYYIHPVHARLLFSRLSVAMEPDRHTNGKNSYHIRSLYFEDLDSSAFFDKINGLENRLKYRIRFYNGDLSYLRLEKKEKRGTKCLKTSETIALSHAEKLLSPTVSPSFDEGALFRELALKIHSQGFHPCLFVDYDRSAFLHPVGNVRITLDTNLFASRFHKSLTDNPLPMPVLTPDTAVLEVKYDSVFPPYLSHLLEDIPKVNCAISKFCLCAQALY